MTRITIVGGTGYAGSAIVREAASRGHDVVSFSRNLPAEEARIEGVRYETGSMLDAATRELVVSTSDVVVSALSPRGELDGRIVEVDVALVTLAGTHSVRLGVVGGFSSLRPTEGSQRMTESGDVPPEFASEAAQMNEVLSQLFATPESADWFFISPAMEFGAYAPGVPVGKYRIGGEVAIYDTDGKSAISGPDFALAIIDEIERPAHRRVHFSAAY